VIEHHLAVMAHADWIIDLGTGRGSRRRADRVRRHAGRPGGGEVDADRRPLGIQPSLNARFARSVHACETEKVEGGPAESSGTNAAQTVHTLGRTMSRFMR
jgi:hypothetical protein